MIKRVEILGGNVMLHPICLGETLFWSFLYD